jgi:hypothetical protein
VAKTIEFMTAIDGRDSNVWKFVPTAVHPDTVAAATLHSLNAISM